MRTVAVVAVVVSVLLAAVLGASAARKARGVEESEELRRRLAIGRAPWLAIGVVEVCAAAGLLLGPADARLGAAAAAGTALLMLGAVAAHLRVRIGGRALAPPVVLLAVAGLASALWVATA